MRHETDLNPTRPALITVILVTLSAGCYRAPELTGSDQVYDPNIEATILKDNDLAALSWPEVDDYMEGVLPNPNEPGCAIGVARGGQVIYLEGYGKAVIGGEAWSVGTMGAVGSVSKTFTAAAMLRMHQLGLVNVNNNVGTYLSTSNGSLSGTMVARLLANSSGVGGATQGAAFAPNWENGSPADNCQWNNDPACWLVTALAARPEVAFGWYEANEAVANLTDGDPGNGVPDQGVYSNVGYSVAGAVIDDIAAGTPSGGYEAWVWDHIRQYTGNLLDADNLLTLALTHSWRSTDIPHRAVGYVQNGGGFDTLEAFDPNAVAGLEGWQGPSGGWAMTIGDLTRFTLALNTSQIVGPAYLAAMRYDWTDLDGFADDYGMGVLLPPNATRPPYWHGGTIGGHNAMWGWWDNYGGQSLGITMICNRDINPFTLAGHAVNIAADIQGTFPIVSAIAVLPPVDPKEVEGAMFALDLSKAWQAAPIGVITPLATRYTLFLEARASERGVALSLSEGEAGSKSPSLGRTYALGDAKTFSNPRFASGKTDVELSSHYGDLELRDLTLEGAFGDRATQLKDVALSAVVDLRQLSPGRNEGPEWACHALKAAGATCLPCADGVRACFSVRFEGIEGKLAGIR